MITQSIRWRLALSYAAIALLAALALGAVLLVTLRDYYARRELTYLQGNAETISAAIGQLLDDDVPSDALQSVIQNFSFLSQTRVRLIDTDGRPLADSGTPERTDIAVGALAPHMISFTQSVPGPRPNYVGFISIGGQVTGGQITATLPMTGAGVTISADPFQVPGPPPPPGADVIFSSALPAIGTPYGLGFDPAFASGERRSDQWVSQPVLNSAGTLLGHIELSQGPAYGYDIVDSVAQGWAIAGGVAVLFAAGVGWYVSRRISAPVLALTGVTARMAEGDLSARADGAGRDELGRLAHSFNEMASRVEATVVALRRFVADAAHELHTPLTALRANLELAGEDEHVARARAQVVRLETLIQGLLDLSRLEADGHEVAHAPVDLTALAQEMGEIYASQAEQAGLAFELTLPAEAVTVKGDAAQLRRALGNLLDNAIKFTPEGGGVSLRLQPENEWAVLSVEDTGIGIPADDLPHLFGRFHRGRNATAYPGSGLGLAIVKAIAESHGGQVTAENTAQGAGFRLRLPLTRLSSG